MRAGIKELKIIAEINIIAVRASSLARDQYYLIARDQNHLVDIGLKKLSSRCWVSERGRSHYTKDEMLITLIISILSL